MKDPREYTNGDYLMSLARYESNTIHAHTCAQLDAKDAEIAALKAEIGATWGALLLLVASVRELDVAEQIQEVAEAVARAHDVLGVDLQWRGGE